MEVRFTHFRTPESLYNEELANGSRAKPSQSLLYYYSPAYGFNAPFEDETPAVRGGMTICTIEEDGRVLGQGVSICSFLDNFCYRLGREIAHGRARLTTGE